jgi:tRNA(fMet)-specific endonuclease VapC
MRYLLDTNVLSSIVRNPYGPAARRFASTDTSALGTSIIAAAELRFGYTRVASRRLERDVEAVLGVISIEDWSAPADFAYARIRTALERSGVSVGQNDMLIAAHAAALGTTLVSDDRIFARITQLKIENWLRDAPAGEG